MNLSGDQIKNSYGALLNIGASGADGTLQPVTDGFGNVLPFEVSTTTINFTGAVTGGPIGPTGAAGSSGTSGTSGVSGSSGTSGVNGANGSSGSSGTSGVNGTSGTSGTSGVSGSSGTSGVSGSAGSSGTSGVNGSSGSSGTSGVSGSSGTSGVSGSSGTSGTSGVSGSSGTSGVNGSSGTSGVSGSSGTSGVSGSSGTSGVSGSSGTSGTSGVNGSSGTSGANGTSGTSGISGTSGTSGVSGTSGTSGVNGATGGVGPTGAAAPGGTAAVTVEATSNLVSTGVGATSGNQNYSVSLGFNANTCSSFGAGDYANIAIGCCSRSTGVNSISIGNSNVSGQFAIGIGHCQSGNADNTTIIGWCASGVGNGGIVAVGNAARAGGQSSTVVGYQSCTTGFYSTVLGNNSYTLSSKDLSSVIGNFSANYSACALVLGSCSTIFPGGTGSLLLGYSSFGGTGACKSVIIGTDQGLNSTLHSSTVMIGTNSRISHCADPNCEITGSVLIGTNSCIRANNCGANNVVIGTNSCVGGNQGCASIAIGQFVTANQYTAVAIGSCNIADGDAAISIGSGANAGAFGVAMGYNQRAVGRSVSVGFDGCANGEGAVVLGRSANATTSCAVAIGYGACACHGSAYVLGVNLTSSYANTVHTPNLVAFGQGASLVNDIGTVTGTATVNWNDSNNQTLTLLGSTTLTFSNPLPGANYMIEVTQGGVGSYTITFPTIKWAYNNPPVLTTTVGGIDVINLFYDGTNYLGTFALNFV